ncbi:MAG: cytochrome c nitrite reductase small subunit [Bacteroidales bacterium]
MIKLFKIPKPWQIPFTILFGVLGGLLVYTFYMSRAWSYASDDPSTCVNCHVMQSQYSSWFHSSHRERANCNNCHVPQDNVFSKYAFKAKDGLYHSYVFSTRQEPQVIRAKEASSGVIMDNCIRCHSDLNTTIVNTGTVCFKDTKEGKGKACWECHRDVAHGEISNLASSPNALVPLPESPVPEWLKKRMREEE